MKRSEFTGAPADWWHARKSLHYTSEAADKECTRSICHARTACHANARREPRGSAASQPCRAIYASRMIYEIRRVGSVMRTTVVEISGATSGHAQRCMPLRARLQLRTYTCSIGGGRQGACCPMLPS